MKYKFDVTFLPEYLVRANLHMENLCYDFGTLAFQITIHLSHPQGLSIEGVKNDIKSSFEASGNKVIEIEGGIVE